MPEFEDNQTNPDLHKNTHNYQPSKEKHPLEPGQENTPTTPSSNMRGRWKRSSRGGLPKPPAKKEALPSQAISINESITEKEDDDFYAAESYDIEDQELEYESAEDTEEREILPPKAHALKKEKGVLKKEKPFKPTSRKDVFIPKTKQDSERYRTRSQKKPTLWRKILAFLGLAAPIKKHTEHKTHAKTPSSPRKPRSSSPGRRPYQQRRHPESSRHRPRSS